MSTPSLPPPLPPDFASLPPRVQTVWLYVERCGPGGASVRPRDLHAAIGGGTQHYSKITQALISSSYLQPVEGSSYRYGGVQVPCYRVCQPHEYAALGPFTLPRRFS